MPAARYKPILDALAADIRSGRLSAGTQLPTHRDLAASAGIAVVTASRIYAELRAMGLVSSEQGRGTFVRDLALPPGHGIDQHALAGDIVDLNFNYPVLPDQAALLRHALRELAGSGDLDILLRYQPHGAGNATEPWWPPTCSAADSMSLPIALPSSTAPNTG